MATTPTGKRAHPTLTTALDADPVLVTVDPSGSWSVWTGHMTPTLVARRLTGQATSVEINDQIWRIHSDEVGWVPEDPFNLADPAATVTLSFKTPGLGSPGGSPAWALMAFRVGDLWYLTSTESIDLADQWVRETDPFRIAFWLTSHDVYAPLTSIEDPSLPQDDAVAIDDIVGAPDENGWTAIWVNGELWFAGDETWEPAPTVKDEPPVTVLHPLSISIGEVPTSPTGRWVHQTTRMTDGPSSSLVVLPPGAPERDLLRIFHAVATSHPGEVAPAADVAVVIDSEGKTWLGAAHVDPEVAHRLVGAIPDATALLCDGTRHLVNIVDPAADPDSLVLTELDRSVRAAAEQIERLDPFGHHRFTDEALGRGWG